MIVMHDLVSALHANDSGRRLKDDDGDIDLTRDPDQPDLVDAITANLLPPCAAIILEKITAILTDSTSFSRNSLDAHHQEYIFRISKNFIFELNELFLYQVLRCRTRSRRNARYRSKIIPYDGHWLRRFFFLVSIQK